jgi:hypothetical protein
LTLQVEPSSKIRGVQLAFVLAIFLGSGLLFIIFFERLPLNQGAKFAIDIQGIHDGLARGIYYAVDNGLRNPPWSVLPLLPLGLLPWRAAWGLLVYLTILVLIISVPRVENRVMYMLSVILLTGSFLSLRNAIDGNLEGLVVAGMLLVVYGYNKQQPLPLAAGILMATAKPQSSVMAMLVLGAYMLLGLPRATWLQTSALVLAVVVPMMVLRGERWVAALQNTYQRDTIMDASLRAALNRANLFSPATDWLLWGTVVVITIYVMWRSRTTLSREKTGMLCAASLLLAPYTAGNNLLVVFAIGVIPLFQKHPLWGGLLIVLMDAQIFVNNAQYTNINAYYSTALLLLSWGVLMGYIWQTEIRPAPAGEVTQEHILAN